jgi:hypothetical protein
MVKWGLYFALCWYNALDVWHTHLLLKVGAQELNPIFNFFGNYVGLLPAIIGIKVLFLGSLGVLLFNYKKEI